MAEEEKREKAYTWVRTNFWGDGSRKQQAAGVWVLQELGFFKRALIGGSWPRFFLVGGEFFAHCLSHSS